jgi:hypothetical protein
MIGALDSKVVDASRKLRSVYARTVDDRPHLRPAST